MAIQLLLVEDVEDLGRSGDVVKVKPGYARNYLLPRRKGVFADANALKMQAALQEKRRKKAEEDRVKAEALAKNLEGCVITTIVKVDQEGHMYGSVNQLDIVHLLQEQHQITIEKKNVHLVHPIRLVGSHQVELKLKEGVIVQITLKVASDVEQAPQQTPA